MATKLRSADLRTCSCLPGDTAQAAADRRHFTLPLAGNPDRQRLALTRAHGKTRRIHTKKNKATRCQKGDQ